MTLVIFFASIKFNLVLDSALFCSPAKIRQKNKVVNANVKNNDKRNYNSTGSRQAGSIFPSA